MNPSKMFMKNQILKHSKIPADINHEIYKQALQINAKLIAMKLRLCRNNVC